MKKTERKPARGVVVFTALLLIGMAGAALAATPTTTDHRNATTPMVTGTAMLVNEHQLLVSTEQGEEVLLSLDSRTMVPADLAPGMMMRVQFKYLDDGSRLAERVIPIRNGERTTRELAYSNERQSDVEQAQYASATETTEQTETHSYGPHAYDTHVSSTNASVTNQPLGTPLTPAPSTQAYRIATEPALAGRVAMVNDHRLVIDTDQGHTVPVEMDSRTLIPSDLQSGMGVRVEYKTMENGTKLATRVVPLRGYMPPEQEMATSTTAYGEEVTPASYNETETSSVSTTADEQVAQNETQESNTSSGEENRLPRTASDQPLIAMLGLIAVAAAAALAMRRRYYRAG